jgi:hypothetical protein
LKTFVERPLWQQIGFEVIHNLENNEDYPIESFLKDISNLSKNPENRDLAILVATFISAQSPFNKNYVLEPHTLTSHIEGMSPNREEDLQKIKELYNILYERTFDKKVPSEVSSLFQNPAFGKNYSFPEETSPVIVFRGSQAILNSRMKNAGLEWTPYLANNLKWRLHAVTSQVVTAYVKHQTICRLGGQGALLNPKNITRLNSKYN